MNGLKNRRILIGGGATGIGAALASRLVGEGARVVVGDINVTALNALIASLPSSPGRAVGQPFDMADAASIESLVATCVQQFGGIDGVAIPAADLSAATLGNDADISSMDPLIWERTMKVNLIGHALLIRAALPHLIAAGGGSIVTVSSGAAFSGSDTMPAYAASKAGLHALTRHVARIGGKNNIRCNAVAPGLVMTDGARVNMSEEMITLAKRNNALPRLGESGDLASALAFLLSDDSSWITGQVLSVNGGFAFRD
jgi:NAD(P)-dependent dehydrogenase (short-subunit alcohol dehydrogenase family)